MKRTQQQENNTVRNSNIIKKPKLESESKVLFFNNNIKSRLEDLANEILYEIFDYLDTYHVYKTFYYLNKRFRNLFMNSNLLTKINFSKMSKLNFENYYINILLPNRNQINLLHLSNPFSLDTIFSPPSIITEFVHLETLILNNVQSKYLNKIFNYLMLLPKFHSLTLDLADRMDYLHDYFSNIFLLSKLNYCQIMYQTKENEILLPAHFTEHHHSPIQYLIINGRFPFESLNNLLSCLPRLHHLSIDSLVKSRNLAIEEELSWTTLKHLKYVSLKFNNLIYFDNFEKIIKKFFHYVQTLRLTTLCDEAYLNASRWETLILSSMPYLRIFDINHDGCVRKGNLTYHELINKFNSSFWTEKQWFFTHRHDWEDKLDCGVFYSTNRYRRQDYTLRWESDNQTCSHVQEMNLNSIKHLTICGKKSTDNCLKYFPNVTQLTIKNCFKPSDDSIKTTLNRIIPLNQLIELNFESYGFHLHEIVKLLRFTPNLNSLRLSLLSLDKPNMKLIQQSESFKYVSNTNKIKHLHIRNGCSLKTLQFIVNLFPKLEYLKTVIDRKDIGDIIRFLLKKSNHKLQNLFFLCISEIPKVCLKELDVLIKLEHLLNDYCIKFVNHDLYLWW